MRIFTDERVEAALEYRDGDRQRDAHWAMLRAERELEEVRAEVYLGQNDDATVAEKNARTTVHPRVKEAGRALDEATAYHTEVKVKTERAKDIAKLYQTESADLRTGTL